jgi:hypothetical protein
VRKEVAPPEPPAVVEPKPREELKKFYAYSRLGSKKKRLSFTCSGDRREKVSSAALAVCLQLERPLPSPSSPLCSPLLFASPLCSGVNSSFLSEYRRCIGKRKRSKLWRTWCLYTGTRTLAKCIGVLFSEKMQANLLYAGQMST